MRYTREMLEEAVKASTCFSDVLRFFNRSPTGGNLSHMKRRIIREGVDFSHFITSEHSYRIGNKNFGKKKHADDILVLRDESSPREKVYLLQRALDDIGVPRICVSCGIGEEWNGLPLVLEIDHVNGKYWDNRKENLSRMCPNCHSQKHASVVER